MNIKIPTKPTTIRIIITTIRSMRTTLTTAVINNENSINLLILNKPDIKIIIKTINEHQPQHQ